MQSVFVKNLKVPITISKEAKDTIKYLCKLIPKEEWSGVLFYTVKGSIKDLSTLSIHLELVYPMHKGSSSFTEYEFEDENFIDFRMKYPEVNMMQMGHIHSHNVMGSFFSPTDTQEITENCQVHNYYLSVIVNNYFDVVARIAMTAELPEKGWTGLDEDGEVYEMKIKFPIQKFAVIVECEVETEEEALIVREDIKEKTDKIIEGYKTWSDNRAAAYKNPVIQGYQPNVHTPAPLQHFSPPVHTPVFKTPTEVELFNEENSEGFEEFEEFPFMDDFIVRFLTLNNSEVYGKISTPIQAITWVQENWGKIPEKYLNELPKAFDAVYADYFIFNIETGIPADIDTYLSQMDEVLAIIEDFSDDFPIALSISNSLSTLEYLQEQNLMSDE